MTDDNNIFFNSSTQCYLVKGGASMCLKGEFGKTAGIFHLHTLAGQDRDTNRNMISYSKSKAHSCRAAPGFAQVF